MKKILYVIAILSALTVTSFAEEAKSNPIQKPESMSQNEWNQRVLSAVQELVDHPAYYEMMKGLNMKDPVVLAATKIYEEKYLNIK